MKITLALTFEQRRELERLFSIIDHMPVDSEESRAGWVQIFTFDAMGASVEKGKS